MTENTLELPKEEEEISLDTSLKPLEELLKAAIYSNYLEKDKSFSVIIIGESELYKTKTLMKFSDNPNISVQTDLTYYGIVEEILPKIQTGYIRTLIIPDLLKATTKKHSTSLNFITCLNSLIEEGVYDITLRTSKNFGGARCNILTCVTPSIYFDKRKYWNKIGFFSRIVPFSFTYSEEMTKRVFHAIGKYLVKDEKIKLNLPTYKKDIKIGEKYTHIAEDYAEKLGVAEGFIFKTDIGKIITFEGSRGFRHKWQFQAMLKAFALMRDASEVGDEDVQKLEYLSHWINYDFNPL